MTRSLKQANNFLLMGEVAKILNLAPRTVIYYSDIKGELFCLRLPGNGVRLFLKTDVEKFKLKLMARNRERPGPKPREDRFNKQNGPTSKLLRTTAHRPAEKLKNRILQS